MDAHDTVGTFEMAWWPRKKRGRHSMAPDPGHPATQAINKAADDLKDSIKDRPEVDRLVQLVQREFGAR